MREKARLAQVTEKEEEEEWQFPQEPSAGTSGGAEATDSEEEVEAVAEYAPLNTAFPADQHINLFEDFENKVGRLFCRLIISIGKIVSERVMFDYPCNES